MKKLHLAGLLIAIMAIVSSCTKEPENINLIPKDADVVINVNSFQLGIKGKLHEFTNMKFFKALENSTSEEEKKKLENLKALLSNPTNTGISLTDNIYFFYDHIGDNPSDFYSGIALSISNEEKFLALLNETEILKDGQFSPKISNGIKRSGYDQISFESSSNKAIFVFSSNEEMSKGITEFTKKCMEQTAENSALENPLFKEFNTKSKDISVYASLDLLNSIPQFSLYKSSLKFDPSKAVLETYLDFQDGKVDLEFAIGADAETKKAFGNAIGKNSIDEKIIASLPEKSIVAFGMGFSPENLYKDLQTSASDLASAEQAIKAQTQLELKDVINAFSGDIAFNFSDISMQEMETKSFDYNTESGEFEEIAVTKNMPSPEATLCIGVKNKEIVAQLFAMAQQILGIKQSEDLWVANAMGYKLYIKITDDKILCSTSTEIAQGKLKSNLSTTELGKEMTKSSSILQLNLDIDNYPEMMKTQAAPILADENLSSFVKQLKCFTIKGNSESMHLQLDFKTNNENSLSTIIHAIDDNAQTLGKVL